MGRRSLLLTATAAGILLAIAALMAASRQAKELAKKFQRPIGQESGSPFDDGNSEATHELSFWREYLKTRGSYRGFHWPEDYDFRLDPSRPLQEQVLRHLDAPPGATVSILDVGSGPLTKLGKRWEGRDVEITAVDALGNEYARLLDELGIDPPVRTRQGEVERLTEHFPKDRFDLVNMENALDHSRDPLLGIRQMLEVVKPGGQVLLRHYENEAETANYEGLHRWNFCVDNGHFVIWNRDMRLSVNDVLGDAAEVTAIGRKTEGADREAEVIVSLRKL